MKKLRELELKIELLYKDNLKHRDDLFNMLKEFSLEVYGLGRCDVNSFIELHSLGIYLVYDNVTAVGFSSFCYNHYYGLREPTIGNDFTYVRKEYRLSKAFHLLSLQTGAVIENNSCNLEHYFAYGSESIRFIDKIKGQEVFRAYEYCRDDVLKIYNSIKEKYVRFKKN